MDKLKNKNTIVLIISAVLILIAIIVAVVATASSGKDKKETTTTPTEEGVSIDLASIADMNNASTTKKQQAQTSYSYEPGKYKIATKDDPLGLRLEPNTSSDRLVYVPKGHEVEVLAVWEDWGYVVYEKTGGWLSMNYLELVSANKKTTEKPTTTTPAEQ
ncbi:MAG: SH3 domain-containing protein [Acutalibacteraceae bacterium]|nr:SH3 domain-containing protein [Acutalibacteraceae bacterium]